MGLPYEIESRRDAIEAEVATFGAWLVDIEWKKFQGRQVITILADKEGGITLEDCVVLNRHLSGFLDGLELVHESYVLEVSSPGLDRPLKSQEDFSRAIGGKVRVVVQPPGQAQEILIGRLVQVQSDAVTLELGKERALREVPISGIAKATKEVSFR